MVSFCSGGCRAYALAGFGQCQLLSLLIQLNSRCARTITAAQTHYWVFAVQEEIERGYLRRAMTLCQDTDYIVRINMCDGLHCLAAAVGLELTVATILPEILELMKDEEPLVRVAAVNSLVAGTCTGLPCAACELTVADMCIELLLLLLLPSPVWHHQTKWHAASVV